MKTFLKHSPVTAVLLGLTVLVFLVMQVLFFAQATSAYAIFMSGGMYGEVIKVYPSQAWRLLTPIVIHIGWEHVILNGLTLYFVGQLAERLFGSVRFLVIYLLSGLMGNLFTLFFSPSVIAAGASTSLFGVFAALALVGYFGVNPYLKQLGRQYQLLLGVNLVFGLFSPDVGMTGHLGGLVGGLLCGVFLSNHIEQGMFSKTMRYQALIAYVLLACLFFGLALYI